MRLSCKENTAMQAVLQQLQALRAVMAGSRPAQWRGADSQSPSQSVVRPCAQCCDQDFYPPSVDPGAMNITETWSR